MGFVASEELNRGYNIQQSDLWALGSMFFAPMSGHYVHAVNECNPQQLKMISESLKSTKNALMCDPSWH